MKILLASDGSFLLNYGFKLLGIPDKEIRIGYIITATKLASSTDFFERYKIGLAKTGYFYEEFDIEGKSKEEIKNFFKDKNIIHIEGGNTFYLLRAIRETGFADILKELLNEGKIYIGTSAGAYVMCPSIEVSTWRSLPDRRFGVEDFTAMNYVPFVLKVHYTDDMEQAVREKMKNLKYSLRILRDGQGILCEDGKFSFKGNGDEVYLE